MSAVKCIRKCVVCGKEFTGSPRSKYCSERCKHTDEYSSVCVICGNPCKKGQKTCSKECLRKLSTINSNNPERIKQSNEKIKQTKLQRYGDANYHNKEKAKQTSLERYGSTTYIHSEEGKKRFVSVMQERYGVDYPLQSDVFKQKMNETVARTGKSYRFHTPEWDELMIKKYGTTIPYKNDVIKQKGINTVIERYGVTSHGKLDFVKEKIKQTCIKKYGVEYSFQSEELKSKSRETILKKYGVENAFFLHRRISKINKDVGALLGVDSYEFPLHNKQYDLKLGNILIEVNPTVSHNSDKDFCFGVKEKEYHFNKTRFARDEGYECFNIWEWDDLDKVKEFFCNKSRIYARQCDVVFIDKKTCDSFLDLYHFQNHCSGDRFRVGLFYNNDLVAVMTFGPPRYTTKAEVELLRLCYKPCYNIIGGSKKMFKFFIDMCSPHTIVSYCDNSKFSGYVYKNLGFELDTYGVPTAHWHRTRDNKHITDALLRQRGADALLGTSFGKGSSNEQIMLDNNFVRVYDCGQSRYMWRSSK